MSSSSLKRSLPPWLDKPLLKLMKARQKAWKRYRLTSSQGAYNRYKEIRNLVNSEKKRKKQLYEESRQDTTGRHAGSTQMGYGSSEFPMEPGPQYSPIQDIWSGDGFSDRFISKPHGKSDDRGRLSQDPYRVRGSMRVEERHGLSSMVADDDIPQFISSYRPLGSTSNISVYDPSHSHSQKRASTSETKSSTGVKKLKSSFEQSAEGTAPSRVLFIRNLPLDITETEVANLALPFGVISNMVITKRSGLALIELMDQQAAENMVDYYGTVYAPIIRGKGPVVVSFSRHTSLTTTTTSQQVAEAIINANKRYGLSAVQDPITNPRSVIRVQLYQTPVGVHFGYLQFYNLFAQFGTILRIVTFKTGTVPSAFIEFQSPISAHVAVLQTDGANFTLEEAPGSGPCIMRTDFSRQSTVEVRSEDANCRDFTRNPMPGYGESDVAAQSQNGLLGSVTSIAPLGLPTIGGVLDYLTEERLSLLDPNVLSELASRMVKPLLKAALNVGGQQSNFFKSQAEVLEHLAPYIPSNTAVLGMQSTASLMASSVGKEDPTRINQSPVVFVSNLNQERITPDTLFTLFGVYGDVQRVKILHNKKDSAMIQLADCNQAQMAVNYLDKVPLYGKQMRCTLSKNMAVTIPVPGKDDSEASAENINQLNREYIGHRLHRFRRPNARYLQNLCAPSRVLHISNLPEQVTEDDLTDVFMRVGGLQVEAVKLVKTPKPMALVQLQDVEKAVTGLIALHDYELVDNLHMRVSFSKSSIR
ncbi:Polypyrimidine tract-binding protein 1 [Clonorchis sinensis]|uniref:Polypyrimidine tract-binding protein 1 n=2 Tax=Clonorchis sinensis TaxID=79923 RepID=A0A8T1M8X4_CLOSI|nr:Polypyrimidine tract-binding protein 1 [Clonorchis sinensis]GAA28121.2 regulator of differentiation 1 [Clonorchis sinensis]